MKHDDFNMNVSSPGEAVKVDTPGYQPLELNYDDYMEDLQDFDMSDDQKRAFLEVLFNIMKSFVELGWGLHSVQILDVIRNQEINEQPTTTEKIHDPE